MDSWQPYIDSRLSLRFKILQMELRKWTMPKCYSATFLILIFISLVFIFLPVIQGLKADVQALSGAITNQDKLAILKWNTDLYCYLKFLIDNGGIKEGVPAEELKKIINIKNLYFWTLTLE